MDTNTIMLIALAILLILSAVGIWLANRGSGVEDPHKDHDVEDDHAIEDEDTVVVDKTHTTRNVKETRDEDTRNTRQ